MDCRGSIRAQHSLFSNDSCFQDRDARLRATLERRPEMSARVQLISGRMALTANQLDQQIGNS